MIAATLEAEVEQYVASFAGEVDEDGRRLVVRNGRARERGLTVGSGRCGCEHRHPAKPASEHARFCGSRGGQPPRLPD
jgi:hypothetical protein